MNSTLLDKLKTLKEEGNSKDNVINLNLYMSPSSNIVDAINIRTEQTDLCKLTPFTFSNMAIIMLNLFICVRVIHFIL